MRDKKYRAYSTSKGDYYRDFLGNISIFLVGDGHELYTTDVIEMFTGLVDKDGTDVYEGDVVLFDDGEILNVSYGIQPVDAFEGVGYNLWSHYDKEQDGTRLQSSIKVIGTILGYDDKRKN